MAEKLWCDLRDKNKSVAAYQLVNTPSHAILNLALLIEQQGAQATLPIVFGAVLPDLPMFALYFWAKFISSLPECQIWSETYYEPFWQNITDTFHSIPLALIGVLIAHYWEWQQIEILYSSAVLHSVFDLPVHNHDAHRHFFPFSNYRFISPISYWDPKHHGAVVTLVERLLVLMATFYVFPLLHSWVGKGLLVAVNLVYLTAYLYFYVFRAGVSTSGTVK